MPPTSVVMPRRQAIAPARVRNNRLRPGHERIRQSVLGDLYLGFRGHRRVADLTEDGDIAHMVFAELVGPVWKRRFQCRYHLWPTVQFNRMTLAIIESYRLYPVIPRQSVGETDGGILSPRKQNQCGSVGHFFVSLSIGTAVAGVLHSIRVVHQMSHSDVTIDTRWRQLVDKDPCLFVSCAWNPAHARWDGRQETQMRRVLKFRSPFRSERAWRTSLRASRARPWSRARHLKGPRDARGERGRTIRLGSSFFLLRAKRLC